MQMSLISPRRRRAVFGRSRAHAVCHQPLPSLRNSLCFVMRAEQCCKLARSLARRLFSKGLLFGAGEK